MAVQVRLALPLSVIVENAWAVLKATSSVVVPSPLAQEDAACMMTVWPLVASVEVRSIETSIDPAESQSFGK